MKKLQGKKKKTNQCTPTGHCCSDSKCTALSQEGILSNKACYPFQPAKEKCRMS